MNPNLSLLNSNPPAPRSNPYLSSLNSDLPAPRFNPYPFFTKVKSGLIFTIGSLFVKFCNIDVTEFDTCMASSYMKWKAPYWKSRKLQGISGQHNCQKMFYFMQLEAIHVSNYVISSSQITLLLIYQTLYYCPASFL